MLESLKASIKEISIPNKRIQRFFVLSLHLRCVVSVKRSDKTHLKQVPSDHTELN